MIMDTWLILQELPKAKVCDETDQSIDSFLASVEKQAFVIAMTSVHQEDVALDIVQDSMLKMVKYYLDKPSDQWPPLFFKILYSQITDYHRPRGFARLQRWFGKTDEERNESSDGVDELPSLIADPVQSFDDLQINDAIQSALQQLSLKQQQALILRLWQGLSVKETAIAMSVSEGSVKTHLSRAVKEMRVHLKEFDDHA